MHCSKIILGFMISAIEVPNSPSFLEAERDAELQIVQDGSPPWSPRDARSWLEIFPWDYVGQRRVIC